MFEWLFGKNKEDTCSCNCPEEQPVVESAPVVFEGTTEELLRATQAMNDPQVEEEPPKEEDSMDQVWTNIEFLKMALEIKATQNQKRIFYIDVGNLPKAKAEQHVKDQMTQFSPEKPGMDYWLPRREGGIGTEIETVPGRVTLEEVLETAQALKDFATK